MPDYVYTTLPEQFDAPFPHGLNNSGRITGFIPSAGPALDEGFLYSNGAYVATIRHPDEAIGGTRAISINNSSQIVGYYFDSRGFGHGFLYSGRNFVDIDHPDATRGTYVVDVNDAGVAAGYFMTDGRTHGFLYSVSGGFVVVDNPLAGTTNFQGTTITGINNAGHLVGSYVDSNFVQRSFFYDGSTFIALPDIPGSRAGGPSDINNRDQIVGRYLDFTGSGDHGYLYNGLLYSGAGYTTIDAPLGTEGTHVTRLNDGGQIVGNYVSDNNNYHGFFATLPPPEPTTVQQEIVGLYAALYFRASEFPGYMYWVDVDNQQSRSGVTVENAATTAIGVHDAQALGQLFATTQIAYFDSIYHTLSDSEFIQSLYVNLGGNRSAEGGVQYWVDKISAAEDAGQTIAAARGAVAGEFVHDLLALDLRTQPAGLSLEDYLLAIERQETANNKIAVGTAYLNSSQQPNGAILNPQAIDDPAYQAAQRAVDGVTFDPATAEIAIIEIHDAVTHQDLSYIV